LKRKRAKTRDRFEHAEDEAAGDRAADHARAADHHHHEGLDRDRPADAGIDSGDRDEKAANEAREHHAERKAEETVEGDRHAHELRRGPVLRHRPHGAAGLVNCDNTTKIGALAQGNGNSHAEIVKLRVGADARNRVLLLGDVKSHKDFAMLFHGLPSGHEAPLGLPEQPSFFPCTKGRATGASPRA
jgi:hypothetical protein